MPARENLGVETHRATLLLLSRHAEKPGANEVGVGLLGEGNPKSLSLRGWQRAGALAAYFGDSTNQRAMAKPQFLFASNSSSLRPYYTLVPLAEKLQLQINLDFGKGDEERLVMTAMTCEGVALIAWQHDYMVAVANGILGEDQTAPQGWPADRFDVTWKFELDGAARSYRFEQVPQKLLGGDSSLDIC